MYTNFCMWCFKYETTGQVWLGAITAKTDEVLSVKFLRLYGDGIHLTVAHKREWLYCFRPDNTELN